jgi:hypothetical protein
MINLSKMRTIIDIHVQNYFLFTSPPIYTHEKVVNIIESIKSSPYFLHTVVTLHNDISV